jgi:uncharacterized Zn finger protein
MTAIPTLSEQDIEEWAGQRAFQRGQRTYLGGAVLEARRQGKRLKALCTGSQPEPYRVQALFSESGLAEARCSCPIGGSGDCKHVVALLLCWRERPESFRELGRLDEALQRQSKAELIELIRQMLRQQPELELLLEHALHAEEKLPVQPETYRRQASALFRRNGRDWSAEAGIAERLGALAEIGDALRRKADWTSAAAVYQGVATAILESYDGVYDEEERIAGVLQRCVEGFESCLAGVQDDPAEREALLRALFEVYRKDVASGSALVEERIAAILGDAELLRLCRESGARYELVARLLELSRAEEAAAEAPDAAPADELLLADLLALHGNAAAVHLYRRHAERLVERRDRASYREACAALQKARTVEQRLGLDEDGAAYLASLRERYRPLRALLEELSRNGL